VPNKKKQKKTTRKTSGYESLTFIECRVPHGVTHSSNAAKTSSNPSGFAPEIKQKKSMKTHRNTEEVQLTPPKLVDKNSDMGIEVTPLSHWVTASDAAVWSGTKKERLSRKEVYESSTKLYLTSMKLR
jgi:hypothetical protein